MRHDSLLIEDIYNNLIKEIHSNVPSGGDTPQKHGYRTQGRHIMPKQEVPKSRIDYTSSPAKSQEDYSIYDTEDNEPEKLDAPERLDLDSLTKEKRREYISAMSYIRMQIDDSNNIKLKALRINRGLMDEILYDLMLGYANSTDVRITDFDKETNDPIFTVNGDIDILVKIPYGKRTNHEDVEYYRI